MIRLGLSQIEADRRSVLFTAKLQKHRLGIVHEYYSAIGFGMLLSVLSVRHLCSQSSIASVVTNKSWAWSGVKPLTFEENGNLHTPWGEGTWGILEELRCVQCMTMQMLTMFWSFSYFLTATVAMVEEYFLQILLDSSMSSQLKYAPTTTALSCSFY